MIVPIGAAVVGFIAQDVTRARNEQRRRVREKYDELDALFMLARPVDWSVDAAIRAVHGVSDGADDHGRCDVNASNIETGVRAIDTLNDVMETLKATKESSEDAVVAAVADAMPQCRICFGDEGTFIKPCKCTGTSKYVHDACLKRWMDASRDDFCRTCGATFELRESLFAACARRIKKIFMPTVFGYAENFKNMMYRVPQAMSSYAPGPIEHRPGLTVLPLKKVKHAIYEFAFQSLRFHVHWTIFNEFHNNKIMSFVRGCVNACVSIANGYCKISSTAAISRVGWELARMISRVSGSPQNTLLDSFVTCAHDKAFIILQRSAPLFVPFNRISYMVVHFPLYSILLPLRKSWDLLLIEKLRNMK